MFNNAYCQGKREFFRGSPQTANPFPYGTKHFVAWDNGWRDEYYWNYGVYP